MHGACAHEAKAAGSADDLPECLLVAEVSDRADEAHWHDSGRTGGEDALLLGVEQPLGLGPHADIGGEILRSQAKADNPRMAASDLRNAEEAAGVFDQRNELDSADGQA